jgi:hypothetical protein
MIVGVPATLTFDGSIVMLFNGGLPPPQLSQTSIAPATTSAAIPRNREVDIDVTPL